MFGRAVRGLRTGDFLLSLCSAFPSCFWITASRQYWSLWGAQSQERVQKGIDHLNGVLQGPVQHERERDGRWITHA